MIYSQTAYAKKLLDPRWQRKRLEILERDDFTCQACYNDTNTMHVHHLYYEKNKEPWEVQSKFLITFCSNCHAEATILDKGKNDFLISTLMGALDNPGMKEYCIEVFENYDVKWLIFSLYEAQFYPEKIAEALDCNIKTIFKKLKTHG